MRNFVRFTLVILLVHLYIGWRLVPSLPAVAGLKAVLTAWLVISYVSIVVSMRMRRRRGGALKDAVCWVGFVAMGLFSGLFMFTVLRDISYVGVGFVETQFLQDDPFPHWSEYSAVAAVALALWMTVYGAYNARRLARVKRVSIALPDLPAGLDGFMIAQISDIHVGPTIKKGYLQAIVKRVNGLNANLIAVTGDIVDGSVAELREDVAPLAQLRAALGVYLVTGNHEYYSGVHQWVAHFRNLGLTVLENEHIVLGHGEDRLVLAGVKDYSAASHGDQPGSEPRAALQGAPAEVKTRILLAHQPRTAAVARKLDYQLQLSGHTHGGQFWPWSVFVPLQQPWVAGLHDTENLRVYISRGTGYWGPPLRFGAPSEITLITLTRKTD